MDEDIYEQAIYCENDGEYHFYYHIYDNLYIVRYYRNHLKSRTHINNIHKKTISNNIT